MTYEFKVGEYKTRDGRKAVVLHALRGAGEHDVLLGYLAGDMREYSMTWAMNGRRSPLSVCASDLMPPPPPRVVQFRPYRLDEGDCIGFGMAYGDAGYAFAAIRNSIWHGVIKFIIEGEGPDARIIAAEPVAP